MGQEVENKHNRTEFGTIKYKLSERGLICIFRCDRPTTHMPTNEGSLNKQPSILQLFLWEVQHNNNRKKKKKIKTRRRNKMLEKLGKRKRSMFIHPLPSDQIAQTLCGMANNLIRDSESEQYAQHKCRVTMIHIHVWVWVWVLVWVWVPVGLCYAIFFFFKYSKTFIKRVYSKH